MNDVKRDMLAREIARRMRRDPNEEITLPSGETLPLWQIIGRTMDAIPAPLRTVLAMQGRSKGKSLRQRLAGMVRRLRPSDGWTDPRDGLPPFEDGGVLSNPVLVKHLDKIKVAVLLCGSPVGSHRWILDKDLPTERYIHVLDIDGWKEIEL